MDNDFNEEYVDLKDKKKFNLFNNKKIIIIISILLITLLSIGIFILIKNNKEKYYISLEGETTILLYEGSEYIELGYKGYDKDNNDLTSKVIVNSNLDTSTIGEYKITYELNGVKKERIIKVISKDIITSLIKLKGNETIYLSIGEKYTEPGYIATDSTDGDITNKVKITNDVNYNKPGKYKIVYSVTNSLGNTIYAYRNVNVVGCEMTLNLSTTKETTDSVNINVNITNDTFSFLILPDGTKTTSKTYSYKVSENGTYKFTAYDIFNTKTESSIKVSNIINDTSKSISLTLSNTKETSEAVNINVKITDDYFYYLVLPDGTKTTNKTYSYKVTTNGTYKFTYYNKNGTKTEKSITVSNIVAASSDKLILTPSTTSKTGSELTITAKVTDSNFSYLILPNGTKTTSKTYSYKVTTNGTYKFTYYNKNGTKAEKSITINNIVSVPGVTVYTSDNITSGNTHNVSFQLKLTSTASSIYYCLDNSNTCNPNIKYTEQLTFLGTTNKYLRYKSCNSEGVCNSPKNYKVNLVINLVNPSESSSSGMANPYQAAYFYQADSRWANYYVYGDIKMRRVGCGYAAYAMIITGITHDYSQNPKVIFEQFKYYRSKYGVEFQSKSTGGGIDYTAINNKYMKEQYGYESYMFWKETFYSASKDTTSALNAKKEKIVSSLKMGHMIFIRVPNHYIALVGIDENENIYIFDPGWKTLKLDIEGFVDRYYDYNDNCTDKEECGFKVAFEIYPKSGMSLEDWKKIG